MSLIFSVAALLFSGCSTFVTPRYSGSADANVALRETGKTGISVGAFTPPAEFRTLCRGAGPLGITDGISHTDYIKQAFENELKMAGMYASESPRVVLSGEVKHMDFSSTRGILGGSWDIELVLRSTNGKSMSVSEHYEFKSGFVADTACKQTAEAYLPAVQDLILKIVRSPDFKSLLE